jgi:RNA polymerase sigma factor (sigma-70 family)
MRVGDDPTLAALEGLYRERLEAFVRTAAAITGSRETGREAAHDAFVSVIRKRASFRGEGPLEAWVWRAVVRAALKARRRERDLPSSRFVATEAEAPRESDASPVLQALVADLPERQRLILFLRYYADLDYQQIAEVLGIRPGTVSAALHAAHRSLREGLMEVARS